MICGIGPQLITNPELSQLLRDVIQLAELSSGTYKSGEQHRVVALIENLKELTSQGGFQDEYRARTVLQKVFSCIFCFTILQPEVPYI